MWAVEYHNDTGPTDEGYWEWWTVTDGEKSFKSDDEHDAKWLCTLLNVYGNKPLTEVLLRHENRRKINE